MSMTLRSVSRQIRILHEATKQRWRTRLSGDSVRAKSPTLQAAHAQRRISLRGPVRSWCYYKLRATVVVEHTGNFSEGQVSMVPSKTWWHGICDGQIAVRCGIERKDNNAPNRDVEQRSV